MGKFVTISAILATTFVGYAACFDYKRRSSPEFRKNLKKRALKSEKESKIKASESNKLELQQVKAALQADLAANPIPTDLAEKEKFFMEQVALGEEIASKSNLRIDAAICFYKALAVYPNPTDILGIYQRSIPEDVYKIVVMMIAVQPPAAITNIMGGEEKVVTEEDLD